MRPDDSMDHLPEYFQHPNAIPVVVKVFKEEWPYVHLEVREEMAQKFPEAFEASSLRMDDPYLGLRERDDFEGELWEAEIPFEGKSPSTWRPHMMNDTSTTFEEKVRRRRLALVADAWPLISNEARAMLAGWYPEEVVEAGLSMDDPWYSMDDRLEDGYGLDDWGNDESVVPSEPPQRTPEDIERLAVGVRLLWRHLSSENRLKAIEDSAESVAMAGVSMDEPYDELPFKLEDLL